MINRAQDHNNLEAITANYKPSEDTIAVVRSAKIALLVGVSGAGKGTIKAELINTGNYYPMVSHTTRKPRVNNGKPEIDGEDYHFIDLDEAKLMVEAGGFVEVKPYSGNLYGTSTDDIEVAASKGKIALNDIEVQGVGEYLEISDRVTALFILPPSVEKWQERTLGRGETDALLARIATAPTELRTALDEPRYHFVINDQLDETVSYVRQIIESGNVDPEKEAAGRELAQALLQQTVALLGLEQEKEA
ncbi:MAG: guanylate kinase [Patescibacteria group bacterium]|nr:guanylate kinase [Patescibacteria group bacterium]